MEENEVPVEVPELTAADGAKCGGELNWAARLSRYDLALPGKRITQRLREWQRQEAAILFRTYRYWKATKDIGIVMYADPSDVNAWAVEMEVDSDHGNDPFDVTSTGSHWLLISGPRTSCPMSWSSKGNIAPGRNTAEVEVVQLDRATFLFAMPICATLEFILRRPVRICARSDNDAAIAAAKKGYSRKLAYLKKYQRTSLAALRHVYVGKEEHEEFGGPSQNFLGHVPTGKNRSDLGTKPMDHARHWELMNRLGKQSLANVRAVVVGPARM